MTENGVFWVYRKKMESAILFSTNGMADFYLYAAKTVVRVWIF